MYLPAKHPMSVRKNGSPVSALHGETSAGRSGSGITATVRFYLLDG